MNGTKIKHIELPVATHSNGRKGKSVNAIVVHHNAGNLTLQQVQSTFKSRRSSAHYDIDVHGNIAQYVDENDRSWCTGGEDPDLRTITIELANDQIGGNWHISDDTINACAELCADICKRYGIKKLYYDGKNGTLLRHCDYQATACPGNYFKSRTNEFCEYVNELMAKDKEPKASAKYKVQTGAFANKENAEAYAETLKKKGIEAIVKEG